MYDNCLTPPSPSGKLSTLCSTLGPDNCVLSPQWPPSRCAAPPPSPAPPAVVLSGVFPCDSHLLVQWVPPSGPVDNITVSYGAAGARPATVCVSPPDSSANLTGLTNGLAYTIRVWASNAGGAGPASTAAPAVPFPSPLAPPSSVYGVGVDSGAQLYWHLPSGLHCFPPVTACRVRVVVPPGSAPDVVVALPDVDAARVGGLLNGAGYGFVVACADGTGVYGGDSAPSPLVTPRNRSAVVPQAPSYAALASVDGRTLSGAWGFPTDDGGAPIQNFTLTLCMASTVRGGASGGDSCVARVDTTTVKGSLTYTFPNLTTSQLYVLVVAAVSAVGEGAPAWSTAVSPAAIVPSPPRDVRARPLRGGAAAVGALINWTAPASTGGAPLLGYSIISQPDVGVHNVSDPSATGAVLGALPPGQQVVFSMTARNAVGSSVPSAPSQPVCTSGQTPYAPGAASAQDSPSLDHTIVVTWTPASVVDQYHPVLDYVIASSSVVRTAHATDTSITLPDLYDPDYYFSVYAENCVGAGPPAPRVGPVYPRDAPPGPPSGLLVSVSPAAEPPGTFDALVSWLPPPGSVVSNFSVVTAPPLPVAPVPGTASSAIIAGMRGGVAYSISIAAANDAGHATSLPVQVVPGEARPGPPRCLAASAPAPNTTTIAWVAPASGATIAVPLGYTLTAVPVGVSNTSRCARALTQVVRSDVAAAANISGLCNGVMYNVSVAALSAAGNGTAAYVNSTAHAWAPTPPAYVNASAGNAFVQLAWPPSTYDGGARLHSYSVAVQAKAGTACAVPGVASFGAAACGALCNSGIRGLTNGCTYIFSVTAINMVPLASGAATTGGVYVHAGLPGTPDCVGATYIYQSSGLVLGGTCGVTWCAPSHGDGPVSVYLVLLGSTGAGHVVCTVAVNAPLNCLLDNLTVGVPRSFVVLASNANGNASATPVSCTPIASAPGVPFLTEGAIVAGNTQLAVSWLAPSWTGGRGVPLGAYSICAYNGSLSPAVHVSNTTLSVTLTGLQNGVSYIAHVQSSNAAGTAIATSAPATPAWIPEPVSRVSAVECDSCIRLTWPWSPTDANGAPMACFSVQQCDAATDRAASGGCMIFNTSSADTLVWESGPRPVGAAYSLRVAGVNALGRGPWSAPPLHVVVAAAPVVVVVWGFPDIPLSIGMYALGGTILLYACLYALNWKLGGDVLPKRDFTALASPLESLWHVATDALFVYAVYSWGPRGRVYVPPFISVAVAAVALNTWRVFVFKAALRVTPSRLAPTWAVPQAKATKSKCRGLCARKPQGVAGAGELVAVADAAATEAPPVTDLPSGATWLVKNGKGAVVINLFSCLSLSCLKLYTCRAFGAPGGPLSAPVPPAAEQAASTAALWVKALKGGAQLGIALGAGWSDLAAAPVALKLAASSGTLLFAVLELRTRLSAARAVSRAAGGRGLPGQGVERATAQCGVHASGRDGGLLEPLLAREAPAQQVLSINTPGPSAAHAGGASRAAPADAAPAVPPPVPSIGAVPAVLRRGSDIEMRGSHAEGGDADDDARGAGGDVLCAVAVAAVVSDATGVQPGGDSGEADRV